MNKHVRFLMILSFVATTVIASTSTNCKAATKTSNQQCEIIYDEYGGYYVETMESSDLVSIPTTCVSTLSVPQVSPTSKTKSIKYYNSNNTLCWKYSLTATFNIKKGISVSYKSSKASLSNNNSWNCVSEHHSGSGGTATGTIKMQTTGKTISKTVTIKCDKNGKFS